MMKSHTAIHQEPVDQASRNAVRASAALASPPKARSPWHRRGAHHGIGQAIATARAPATFGELLQGRDPLSGHDFLVTLPITLQSVARYCGFEKSTALYVFPADKAKSLKAARLFLQKFGIDSGGILQISSGVSEGKGLASSSADIVATLRALANYFDVSLGLDDMLEIIRQIEPTDGVMFDESVAFFHRRVELGAVIGKLPRMCMLAIDEGGMIDTVSYNKRHFDFSDEEKHAYGALLDDITAAIRDGDVRAIGSAATASTRLHQKRNRKETFAELERILAEVEADGIVNCHSGTLIGLCFDASHPESLDKISRAEVALGSALQKRVFRFFTN